MVRGKCIEWLKIKVIYDFLLFRFLSYFIIYFCSFGTVNEELRLRDTFFESITFRSFDVSYMRNGHEFARAIRQASFVGEKSWPMSFIDGFLHLSDGVSWFFLHARRIQVSTTHAIPHEPLLPTFYPQLWRSRVLGWWTFQPIFS